MIVGRGYIVRMFFRMNFNTGLEIELCILISPYS